MILNRLGNKKRLASTILPFIPDHHIWFEPFFGAGGMFFSKPRAPRNIVNDLDGEVFNLFCVVLDKREELEKAWASMPIHEDLWKHWKQNTENDPVRRAVRFLFQSNFGFMGKPQTLRFNTKNTKRLLQERIARTQELLYDVEFMNIDFRAMLGRVSLSVNERKNAFVYCDPPYLHTGNNYGKASGWGVQDSRDLFAMLVATGMRFAVSEFDTPEILAIAEEHALRVHVLGERRALSARRTEVLITSAY